MSNVLKKITKKYKWLRFLNYKTTKLAVLSAALFGLCLSSGASFAKYRDENYGGGNAGAAKFEYGLVTFNPVSIQEPQNYNNTKGGTHVFGCEFQLEVPKVEVAFNYTIKLRLVARDVEKFDASNTGLTNTKFVDNSNNDSFHYFYEDTSAQDVKEKIKTSTNSLSIATGETVTYKTGHWYKGEKTNLNVGYSFKSSSEIEGDVITFDTGTVEAGTEFVKYFKILIFVNAIKSSSEWNIEDSQILYSYHVEQVVPDDE